MIYMNKNKSLRYQNNHYECPDKKLTTDNDDLITSYGMHLFYIQKDNCDLNYEIYVLIQQARDTFAYIEFLRGLWRNSDEVPLLFSSFSIHERKRIREYIFEELWDDLFINKTSKLYKDGYLKAKKKYDSIKHLIPHILDTTQTFIGNSPWGFPKGKKNDNYETDIECAFRETIEETRLDINDIKLFDPPIKHIEIYKGTNGKMYSTHYFLAEVTKMYVPEKLITNECIRKSAASEEINEVMWIPVSQAGIYLDDRRHNILCKSLKDLELRLLDR